VAVVEEEAKAANRRRKQTLVKKNFFGIPVAKQSINMILWDLEAVIS
jgi:hypothetical protein